MTTAERARKREKTRERERGGVGCLKVREW